MKHLPNLLINIIPHNEQVYDTPGNYTKGLGDDWYFDISETEADYEFLVLIHELIEWHLTQKRGITEKSITDFDILFELNRKNGNTDEPGNSPLAPYRKEHKFATKIERLVAKELKVNWSKYDKKLNNLNYND